MRIAAVALLAAALLGCDREPVVEKPVVPVQGSRFDEKPVAKSTPTPQATPAAAEGDYAPAGFDLLASYSFELPELGEEPAAAVVKVAAQIPEAVKALSGRRLAVKGFMMPTKGNDGKISEFYLMRFMPACCFGDTIKMNEWVEVRMKAGRFASYNVYTPITVHGVFEVNPSVSADGFVSGIYRMEGEDAP